MDLKDIIQDYELNFNNKRCIVSTGYNKLPEFTVMFDVKDLYHLLGIHKLQLNLHATSWVEQVKKDAFQLGQFSKHPVFYDILPRINNYDFIYEIFYQSKVKVCVLEKDLSKNTMHLSVVFYKQDGKKVIVMGLRKDRQGYLRPVTLHESRGILTRVIGKL